MKRCRRQHLGLVARGHKVWLELELKPYLLSNLYNFLSINLKGGDLKWSS